MARGGFHGGSSHSGGHHSGGGGHHSSGGHYSSGGHFGGGGHYSGGSHFGGGGHYSGGYSGGGSNYGGDGGDLIIFGCGILAGGAFLILYLIVLIAEGNVPGLNLVNLGIFIASCVLFSIGLKEFDRTSDLNDLIKYKGEYPFVSGKVWKGNSITYKKGDKLSWVGKYNYEYRISFYDPEFGAENAKKVLETIDRTPKIIWINPFVWLVLGIVFCVSTFFFYEGVIPHFERMKMTDLAFWFIDELVFYLPSILTLLCSVSCLLIVRYKDRILYKCAERIVEDNTSSEERAKTEEFINSQLSKKWYHNSCPNCGAPASFALRSCQSCGSSLEVKSFESEMPGAVHKVSSEAESKE